MSDKLITVATFDNDLDAQLARMRLETNDIKSTIVGENIMAIGLYPLGVIVKIELQVFENDLERAKEILESPPQTDDQQQEDAE